MVAVTESDILARVIAPSEPTFDANVARAILALSFNAEDRSRMSELAQKANEGELSADEQHEIDVYERVGHFVSLIKSKARQSLKQAGQTN